MAETAHLFNHDGLRTLPLSSNVFFCKEHRRNIKAVRVFDVFSAPTIERWCPLCLEKEVGQIAASPDVLVMPVGVGPLYICRNCFRTGKASLETDVEECAECKSLLEFDSDVTCVRCMKCAEEIFIPIGELETTTHCGPCYDSIGIEEKKGNVAFTD